jgi:hypothetical protein
MKKCFTLMGAAVLTVSLAVAQEVPKFQAYFGYDYVRFHPVNGSNTFTNLPTDNLPFNPFTTLDQFRASGASMQLQYNFNKWISGVADLGGVHNGGFNGFAVSNNTYHFVFGPRISIRKWKRVTPFLETLFGGTYYSASGPQVGFVPVLTANGDIIPGDVIAPTVTSHQVTFALMAGGGVDIRINKHISFRPAQVDYYMTQIANPGLTNSVSQNNFRYSGGISFLWGYEKKTPPPAARQMPKQSLQLSLTPSSTQVCPGDTVTVTPSIVGANPNELKFVWYVNGQPISQGQSFSFGTEGRQPGNYRISLAVNGANFNPAQAETSITVLQYQPPSGTVSANPAQVEYGDKSSLSSNFSGQCGKCAIQTPTYTASEGTINGDQFDSTGVQFSNSGTEQHKTVTITATASDCTSNGTATTTVDVTKKATIAPVRLPDVLFDHDNARVNNCGKRVLLEQLRAYVEKDPTGTVVLVGNQSPDETVAGLDMKRVSNAAAVITAGTGVCMSVPQSQVMLEGNGTSQNDVSFESGFCGSSVRGGAAGGNADLRRVAVWFVPSGGQMPAQASNLQSAQSLNISGLGCPR